jgi:hypothetical protein
MNLIFLFEIISLFSLNRGRASEQWGDFVFVDVLVAWRFSMCEELFLKFVFIYIALDMLCVGFLRSSTKKSICKKAVRFFSKPACTLVLPFIIVVI